MLRRFLTSERSGVVKTFRCPLGVVVNCFRFVGLVLVSFAVGCGERTAIPRTDVDDPIHIQTVYWTNMPPPSEANVNRELEKSVGKRITINGARHSVDGHAAIWIPENTVIEVPQRTEWLDAPSHRSHVMVTGLLSKNGDTYTMTETTYEWLDQ